MKKQTNNKLRLVAGIPFPLAIAGGLMIFLAALPAAPEENADQPVDDDHERIDDEPVSNVAVPAGIGGLLATSLATPLFS